MLILLVAVSPLPTLTLLGYETWSQHQLPLNLFLEKSLDKLFPGQPDDSILTPNQSTESLPAEYSLWGANVSNPLNTTTGISRKVLVTSAQELRQAVARAQPGTLIQLSPGTYPITHKIQITNAGIRDAPILLMAEQLNQVKLKVNTTEGVLVNAPYWTFQNLDIEGVCTNHSQCEHAFHIVGMADHTTLRNNRIYNFNAHVKGNGIGENNAREFPDDVLLQGNSFFNTSIRNTANPVTLIDVIGGERWMLRENLIADFSKGQGNHISYGAFLKGNGRDGIIEQNLVICEMGLPADQGIRIGLSLGGGGSSAYACQNNNCDTEHRNGVIRNNIVMDCSKDVGIYLNRAQNTLIAHNTLSHTLGIDVRYATSTATVINNAINGRLLVRDEGSYSSQNNFITQKTLFTLTNLKRWLNSSTPMPLSSEIAPLLVNTGIPSNDIDDDFCGKPRADNLPDIGAVELSNTSICRDDRAAQLTPREIARTTSANGKVNFRVVTPNPIVNSIRKGIKVKITDLVKISTANKTNAPSEVSLLLSGNDHSDRLFVSSMNGQIHILKSNIPLTQPFLDLALIRMPHFYWDGTEKGLVSFTFHPDFALPGTPGYRKFYTAHSERPSGKEDNPGTPVFASTTGLIHHYSIITEWMVKTDNPDIIDQKSRREVLRIAQPLRDHNVGMIAFKPNTTATGEDYGLLYIAVGDGGNTVKPGEKSDTDKNRLGQDTSTIFGSIIRINPFSGSQQPGYQIPQNNPFVGRTGYAPEIWAYGFRNPQHFSWDIAGSGQMFIADIGQTQIEEINLGLAGANYGWSEREGTFATNHEDQNELFERPLLDRLSKYTYPIAQYDHDEGRAITGGYVYRGQAIPELYGKYIFGDIHNGRIFYIDTDQIRDAEQTRIFELQLIYQGEEMQLLDIMKTNRADLRFGVDDQNEIYVLTKQDGMIRKLVR